MRRRTIVAGIVAVSAFVAASWASGDEIARRVEELTGQVAPSVVEWRRDFHANPELANREERTSRVVAERLREIGVDDVKTGVAHHGVVALVRGSRPGRTVALRADMDALPIMEQSGVPFASKNPGAMHACGHDAHTAMLLGAAKVLVQMRDAIPGTVKLIFQPAEEGTPAGEEGGARMMVKEGVLRDPDVAAIFGQHVDATLPAGAIGYRFGATMAAVDRFKITVTGKQSHAAQPWDGIDPIVASAHIITALQTVPSRTIDAREPIVVSVGIIKAGTAWNIIPAQAVMEGTVRTHDPDVRRRATEQFDRIVRQTAAAHGASVEIERTDYGPVVWNDAELGQATLPAFAAVVGEKNVVERKPVMGGEDFAHYAVQVPGFYWSLGIRNEAIGAVHGLHTPQLVLDEAALPLGVRALSLAAINYLRTEPVKSPP